jgi:hypothetical protein
VQAKNRGYPNGETRLAEGQSQHAEHIGVLGERGELKHLSTRRRREDSLSSGERKGSSPNPTSGEDCGRCLLGVVGPFGEFRRTLKE